MKQAATPEFKEYQTQVLKNAKALESEFKNLGYRLVSNGTDSHMVLVSLREKGVDGARVEYICEKINIALNKNSIPGDKSALVPGGVRIGAPAMTTRGMGEEDFHRIVQYINKAVEFAQQVQQSLPKDACRLKDFKAKVDEGSDVLNTWKKEIYDWAGEYPLAV